MFSKIPGTESPPQTRLSNRIFSTSITATNNAKPKATDTVTARPVTPKYGIIKNALISNQGYTESSAQVDIPGKPSPLAPSTKGRRTE
jgi:hypothetical protein